MTNFRLIHMLSMLMFLLLFLAISVKVSIVTVNGALLAGTAFVLYTINLGMSLYAITKANL